jgi:hypothetical protein
VGSRVGSGVGATVGAGVGVGAIVGAGVGVAAGVAMTLGSTVARTGTVETSALTAGDATTSVGAGVASSGRQARTTNVPTTSSADHLASREARLRVPSKVRYLQTQLRSPSPTSLSSVIVRDAGVSLTIAERGTPRR